MKYPEQNENYDVDVFNDNFRELDLKGEQIRRDLQAEVARADAAEKANAAAISAEAERATAQETIIDNKFTAEATAIRALIDTAYASANGYTDEKIANLINGAPETLDTLKEIADALEQNEDVVEALNNAIGTKADQNELDLHTSNTDIHVTVLDKSGWNNPVFTEAEERENIASGDSTPTLWGKVKKWFSSLKAVCFSGSYNDLSDTPTIGNAMIKIKQGGVEKGSFTTNQSGEDVIVELEESGGSVDPSDITPASIGAVAKAGDTMTGRLEIKTVDASSVSPRLITSDETNQRIFYGSNAIESVTPSDAVGILELNPHGNACSGRVVVKSPLHIAGGLSVNNGIGNVVDNKWDFRFLPVFKGYTEDAGTGGTVGYMERKVCGLAPFWHWTTSCNYAAYYYKITVGAKDTDAGIVDWMISFELTVFQSYRYCKFAISGYLYCPLDENGVRDLRWYEPRAEMIAGDREINNMAVWFGKDTDGHLYVAVYALAYTGLVIDAVNVAYQDVVVDYSSLFSLSVVPTLDDTTKYKTQNAYRPFYLDEANELKNSVSNGKAMVASAITSKGIYVATDAPFATFATAIKSLPYCKLFYDVSIGIWWMNSNTSYDMGEIYIGNSTSSSKYADIYFGICASSSANADFSPWNNSSNWEAKKITYTLSTYRVSDGTLVDSATDDVMYSSMVNPYGIDALKSFAGCVLKHRDNVLLNGSDLRIKVHLTCTKTSFEIVSLFAFAFAVYHD